MKRIITILFFACSLYTQAQIKVVETTPAVEVGKIAPGGITTLTLKKIDDVYIFNYKDAKFTKIEEWKSFEIKDVDNALEDFYKLIEKGFAEMPKEDIMIETNDSFIWLKFDKFLGAKILQFGHSVSKSDVIGFSNQYTEKQVKKLFGKK